MRNSIRSIARLRHIVAVAQHRSYSRAAVALHLSQSALSRSILSIEEELGQALFHRTPTGIVETAAGAVFLRHAISLLTSVDRLEGAMRQMARSETEVISFGIGPLQSVVLPDLFSNMLRSRPHPRLKCQIMPGAAMRDLLMEGAIDFAICSEGSVPPSAHLVRKQIGSLEVGLHVREGHPLRSKPRVAPLDLADFPIVGPAIAEELTDEFSPGAIYNPEMSCENLDVIARAVELSDAICILPTRSRYDRLAILRVSGEFVIRDIAIELIVHDARPVYQSAQNAISVLVDLLAQKPSGQG